MLQSDNLINLFLLINIHFPRTLKLRIGSGVQVYNHHYCLQSPSHLPLLPGMETERLQEEEEGEIEQSLPPDDQGWPPLNTIRPWRSAPPTPPHSRDQNKDLGPRSASMLSLQTELFLDLVAEAQSKRLEGQRATFHIPSGSLATTSVRVQVSEDRDQLYSTILSHQCQRIEAQRSDPPLPPGGQELLELLLRVQGNGRMEEQRSRPPSHTC